MRRVLSADPQWDVRALSHEDVDITAEGSVHALLQDVSPLVVVNCAAYNGVESAETHPGEAFAVNTSAVASLALACRAINCLLVHFSTDYVHDGAIERPYCESDTPCPLNIYGLSKLAGEQAVRLLQPRHCIIRTCGLYGRSRSPRGKLNFVEKILQMAERQESLEVRSDLVCTPTSASELAGTVGQLIERETVGTFNITNAGSCSWYEFARAILEEEGISGHLRAVSISSEGARRPRWSVLSGAKLESIGVRPLSPWRAAVADYLRQRRK